MSVGKFRHKRTGKLETNTILDNSYLAKYLILKKKKTKTVFFLLHHFYLILRFLNKVQVFVYAYGAKLRKESCAKGRPNPESLERANTGWQP